MAALSVVAPMLTLVWIVSDGRWREAQLAYFAGIFVLLGAVGNGATIAQLGYLMEISPNDRRPAYSGYFNVLAAPAALLPIAGGAVVQASSAAPVFALSLAAAMLQFLAARGLGVISAARAMP